MGPASDGPAGSQRILDAFKQPETYPLSQLAKVSHYTKTVSGNWYVVALRIMQIMSGCHGKLLQH
jgi:hypothetical protein